MKKGKIFSLVASLAMVLSLMVMPVKVDAAGNDAENATLPSAQDGVVKLVENVDLGESTYVFTEDTILDLNGYTLTVNKIETSAELTIKDSTALTNPEISEERKVTYKAGSIIVKESVLAKDGGKINMTSGIVESEYLGLVAAGDNTGSREINSTITMSGGYIIATEFSLTAQGKGAIINFNNGVAESKDNAVIAGNGTNTTNKKLGDTTINMNGGTLIGHIKSNGYSSCGIYHPQRGNLNITGGLIYSENGCGILMRGGNLSMTGGEVIAEGSPDVLGKVGDSNVVVSSSGIVLDMDANYYDVSNVEIELNNNVDIRGTKAAINVVNNKNANIVGKINVKGGLFSSDVTEYISDEYKAYEQTDGTFKVAPKATSVTLDKENASLDVGEILTLKATLNPTETLDKVTYTTSDEKVATVDANGKVTAISYGKATITATANGKTATCEVTVTHSATKVEAKDPTYTEAGNIAYWHCTICDKYFSDEALTKEIKLADTVLAKLEATVDVPTIDTSKPVEEVTAGVDTTAKETVAKETETIIADITAGKDVTEVVSKETAAAIEKAVEEGKTIETKVVADTVKEEAVDKEDVAKVEEKVGTTGQIAQYLDLRVEVMIAGEEAGTINVLSKPIQFTVAIPEELQADGREFYVVRVHDGVAEKLETTLNEDGTISFETDKFSTYALVYVDKKVDIIPDQKPEEEPTVKPEENTTTNTTDKTDDKVKTSDDSNTMLYASFAGLALVGGAIVVAMKKKEELLNK